jgi:hypothetical protein
VLGTRFGAELLVARKQNREWSHKGFFYMSNIFLYLEDLKTFTQNWFLMSRILFSLSFILNLDLIERYTVRTPFRNVRNINRLTEDSRLHSKVI